MSSLETNVRQLVQDGLTEREKPLHARRASHSSTIETMAVIIVSALAGGRRIYLCRNGGNASAAQLVSAELIGRFKFKRRAGRQQCGAD